MIFVKCITVENFVLVQYSFKLDKFSFQALEPFLTAEDLLTLDEFFATNPDYSVFGSYLDVRILTKLRVANNSFCELSTI